MKKGKMLKTLIVEDDSTKLQKVVQALAAVDGFDVDNVDSVVSVNDARKRLKENGYDLLILDISLPNRIDQEVTKDGGIRLLTEIMASGAYKMPTHIIGITAHKDVLQEATQHFSEKMLTVVHYDMTSDEWALRLQERTRHMLAAKVEQNNLTVSYQSHLAVVCALHSPELDAVLRLDWSMTQYRSPGDDTIYYKGCFEKDGNKRIIYAAAAPRMGMAAATALSMKMIYLFRPRYIAMVGITAGIPKKTKFGDILVADPAYDYGNGKWESDGGKQVFEPSAHQLPLAGTLRSKLKAMEAEYDTLSKIRHGWPADVPSHELSLKVGPVASGASVIADNITVSQIQGRQRDVIGVEMETYGMFVAADEAPLPKPLAFSMKSVVDFGDGQKDDQYQRYAAYTSARSLKHFVERHLE